MSHTTDFISDAAQILARLDPDLVDRMVAMLLKLRERGGRLFLHGNGGCAANAAHAVSAFRQIAQIEAYAPTDNVAELTAHINETGWETGFTHWLHTSQLNDRDMVFVLSVGGGDLDRNISSNLVRALEHAQKVGATICGIVGRHGGYTARVADACILVPTISSTRVTPHVEAFQSVLCNLMVSHPSLRVVEMERDVKRRRAA